MDLLQREREREREERRRRRRRRKEEKSMLRSDPIIIYGIKSKEKLYP